MDGNTLDIKTHDVLISASCTRYISLHVVHVDNLNGYAMLA